MSDLSLTGKSISPIQQGARSYSARSTRSSASDYHRTATQSDVKVPRSSLSTRPKRRKPAMALEFPKNSKPSPRSYSVDMPKTNSSHEYLTLFETPRNANHSSPRTLTNSNIKKPSKKSDRDRFEPTTNFTHNTTQNYHRSFSTDLPKYKPVNSSARSYKSERYKESVEPSSPVIVVPISDNERVVTSTFSSALSQNNNKAPKPISNNNLLKREEAAKKIQTWYKRHSVRAKSSEAALKRMLHQKKIEVEGTMHQEEMQTKQRTDEQKRKQRREREREERKRAIAELRKSREEQDRVKKSLVDEEMAIIAEKQKQSRIRTVYKNKKQTERSETSDSKVIQNVEDKIDRIFEETKFSTAKSSSYNSAQKDDIPSQDEESIPEELPESPGETTKSQGLLESLLETIQQLEAEPEQLTKIETNSKLDEKLAWIDEMQADHLSSVSNSKVSGSARGAGDFIDGTKPVQDSTNNLLTKAKLSNLMEFLDNVEKQDEKYEAARSHTSHVSEHRHQEISESDKMAELVQAEKAASQVTTELLKLRLNVDEKTKSVDLLKKALAQQRELTVRHAHEQEKEMNQRLKMQKEQYESTIQRHLSFIDQLIDDKKVLGEKCERVVIEMKQAESKYQKKIKELQEAHAIEVRKQKEVLSAAEKLRREKWIEDKTKTIKEMTVKGLEPEIQRLIAKHKQEVKKIKAIHEAELLQSDERAGQRYIRQTEELREHLEREKDAACNREREMARQRYEKQLEQEEIALQQQRRRLYAEVSDEKERLNEQAARQRADIDRLKEQLEKHNSLATSALTDEYEKSKEEAERRHTVEIETLKERLELEKQAWQETYMKKQEAYVLQKERELKDAVRQDRDSEIETVIEQLEKDMGVQRSQIEKTAENRIKRIREKYESELKEIEVLERQTHEKYNNMKVQYSDMEGENMRLKSTIAHKEQEILDVKKVKNRLVEERGNVTDIIRDEFAERLVHTEEENKRMKNEIAQMRARHRLELDRVNQEKEEELAEVHKRVKAAIVKKEESVAQIKQQHESAVKRADHLEGLLEAQRKQLLGRKK
uniref:centrosomal protein of 131 kDa-like n=1 Tax=Styela clava TaxID=7725 RepID=UPI00193A000D|nr:centrosomal protein of 131 kDa-like [Styela clava]XP_039254154.1 centrosomal protein of 131 kDa-like [Styela clava]